VGREGAFFLYQLNVHTFNCHRRTDRRVQGWLQRDGWAEGWVGGGMGGWVDRGGVLLFILGSNLGGVVPERGLRGGGRRGWCEEWARSG
jgi:hypothetical protein